MKRLLRHPLVKLVVALALLLPVVSHAPSPASASGPALEATGYVTANPTHGNFSKFPCPRGERCIGLIKGTWSGHLTAEHDGETIAVAWETPLLPLHHDQWHMRYNTFDDICAIAPEGGAGTGFAEGRLDAWAAGQDILRGTVVNPQEGTMEYIERVTLGFDFDWTRIGASAQFTTKVGSMNFTVTTPSRNIMLINALHVGVADFTPTPSTDPVEHNDTFPSCHQSQTWTDLGSEVTVNMPLGEVGPV